MHRVMPGSDKIAGAIEHDNYLAAGFSISMDEIAGASADVGQFQATNAGGEKRREIAVAALSA
jgi:hypothetical protein